MHRQYCSTMAPILKLFIIFCLLTKQCVFDELKSPKNVIVLEKADSSNFQHYSWNKISLLALTDVEVTDTGIVKEAHSHHVNIILVTDIVKEFQSCSITDKKCRNDWISDKVNILYKTEMEGLLMKISGDISNSTFQDAVISLFVETSNRFEDADLDYVTAWLPSDTKGDFLQRIVKYVRWVAVQIQQSPPSVSGSGSSSLCKAVSLFPLEQAMTDIYQLISLYNIPSSKLMPVFPWKGIEYDCKEMVGSDCFIPCSSQSQKTDEDAQISADVIEEMIISFDLIPSLDLNQDSFYIRMDVDEQNIQVYFDTYLTLPMKYELVESFQLGGLVVWSASDVTYTSSVYQRLFARKMWSYLPSLE